MKAETVVSDLTYDLRSGAPDFLDTLVAATFGTMAYDSITSHKTGLMASISDGKFAMVPIPDPKLGPRHVDIEKMYNTRAISAELRQQRRSPRVSDARLSAMANTSQSKSSLPSEVVEAQGHLIDSHIMERIFDTVVEFGGNFEVEQFAIGRTNSEPSSLRLRVTAPSGDAMEHMMTQLLGLGCAPVDSGDAELKTAECDRCAPEEFYSTTNQRTLVRSRGQWLEVGKQRMDAMIVVDDGRAECRRLRDLKAGDPIVVGMKGIRVIPEAKERDRLSFSFMSNEISSERQVETAVAQTAAMMKQVREDGKKIVAVAGPVVVHTGGCGPMTKLLRHGWIDAILAGNALAVHDIESALLGTSLGVRTQDGRLEEHGHRNHMRAINAIYHAGGIRQAVESGRLTKGRDVRVCQGERSVRSCR